MITPPSRLRTPQVVLRRWDVGDGSALDTAIEESREHLRPFMPWASDSAEPGFRQRWLAEKAAAFDDGKSFAFGLFSPAGEVVGGAAIAPVSDDEASIGYWVHASHVRRGIGTAAANALTQAALNAGCRRVRLRHDAANVASRAIPERVGFSLVGSEPHSIDAPGQTGTSLVWVFDADDLEQRWKTLDQLLEAKQQMIDAMPGFEHPAAYAVARYDGDGLSFAHINQIGGAHQLPAVVLAAVTGYRNGNASIELTRAQFADAVRRLAPAGACLDFDHPNLWSWQPMLNASPDDARFVAVFVGDVEAAPVTAEEESFRRALRRT